MSFRRTFTAGDTYLYFCGLQAGRGVGLLGNLVSRPKPVQNLFKFFLVYSLFFEYKIYFQAKLTKKNTFQNVIGFLIVTSMSRTECLTDYKSKMLSNHQETFSFDSSKYLLFSPSKTRVCTFSRLNNNLFRFEKQTITGMYLWPKC